MQYLNNISTDDCVGRVLDSKSFGKFKVINYENSRKVTVEFLETGYRKVCNMKELRTGAMKDTTLPSIYGVGCMLDTTSFTTMRRLVGMS